MTHSTRTPELTPRALLIHTVMRAHARRGAHTCSCGHEYPLGTDTTLHVAACVDLVLELVDRGLTIDSVTALIDTEPDPRRIPRAAPPGAPSDPL